MATASRAPILLVVASVLAATPVRGAPNRPVARESVGSRCALDDVGSDQAASRTCTRCHSHRQSHPYDIDYASAAGGHRLGYAPAEQVVRAGVLLPNGEIRCVTCHDRRSPWKYKIALPPGARPSPSVNAWKRNGFERPVAVPDHMPPGSEVTPTPLCRVCHQF